VIRRATEADIGALVALAREFHAASQYSEWSHFSGSAVTEMLQGLLSNDDALVLVLEGLTGAIGGVVSHSPVSGDLMAVEMFWWVQPAARGNGLRLLLRLEEWARERGAVHLAMVAPDKAENVHRLYERRGYAPVERQFVRAL